MRSLTMRRNPSNSPRHSSKPFTLFASNAGVAQKPLVQVAGLFPRDAPHGNDIATATATSTSSLSRSPPRPNHTSYTNSTLGPHSDSDSDSDSDYFTDSSSSSTSISSYSSVTSFSSFSSPNTSPCASPKLLPTNISTDIFPLRHISIPRGSDAQVSGSTSTRVHTQASTSGSTRLPTTTFPNTTTTASPHTATTPTPTPTPTSTRPRIRPPYRTISQRRWVLLNDRFIDKDRLKAKYAYCNACGGKIRFDKRMLFNDGFWNKHKKRCREIKNVFRREEEERKRQRKAQDGESNGDEEGVGEWERHQMEWEDFLRPAIPPPERSLPHNFVSESENWPKEALEDSDDEVDVGDASSGVGVGVVNRSHQPSSTSGMAVGGATASSTTKKTSRMTKVKVITRAKAKATGNVEAKGKAKAKVAQTKTRAKAKGIRARVSKSPSPSILSLSSHTSQSSQTSPLFVTSKDKSTPSPSGEGTRLTIKIPLHHPRPHRTRPRDMEGSPVSWFGEEDSGNRVYIHKRPTLTRALVREAREARGSRSRSRSLSPTQSPFGSQSRDGEREVEPVAGPSSRLEQAPHIPNAYRKASPYPPSTDSSSLPPRYARPRAHHRVQGHIPFSPTSTLPALSAPAQRETATETSGLDLLSMAASIVSRL
ncbi:hypothetical protein D9758_010872 [Tetrapyrgos nigripes]|uniref:Uncharacterized protein n=1 Tax=Tetrapyrgos nigripes TaxID=182062 RepID=A0A8H5GIM4_9AGAR|nr:hypothetical protein D9758_010872 [Tetrapyrgos nigripes]